MADRLLERLLSRGFQLSAGPAIMTDEAASPHPLERYLDEQLDRLRDDAGRATPSSTCDA